MQCILDSMPHKNYFDSSDNKSSLSMNCYEEKVNQDTTQQRKYSISPSKIMGGDFESKVLKDLKIEENFISPFTDKLGSLWLNHIDFDEIKNFKYSKLKNTPQRKAIDKQSYKRTPCKGFENLNENFSPYNENSMLSPKKGMGFGGAMVSSPFIMKSPLMKQISNIKEQQSTFFDDAYTKAENSNLFSNKSNQI